MTMDELGEPKFVEGNALRVAGLAEQYTMEQMDGIPKQWDRFMGDLQQTGRMERVTYGISLRDGDRPMRYISGVDASEVKEMPPEWEMVEIAPQHYAVFAAEGGVDVIRQVWIAIWSVWLPQSGRKVSDGPMLEWYAPGFGGGEIWKFEIWVPVLQ